MPRFPLQDIQRLQAEPGHHPLRHRRTDPLDRAGCQKALDRRQRRRLDPPHHLAAKLFAVFGMRHPTARHFHVLARQWRAGIAGDHDHALVRFQTKNDIFILALERDILDNPRQNVHHSSHFLSDYQKQKIFFPVSRIFTIHRV